MSVRTRAVPLPKLVKMNTITDFYINKSRTLDDILAEATYRGSPRNSLGDTFEAWLQVWEDELLEEVEDIEIKNLILRFGYEIRDLWIAINEEFMNELEKKNKELVNTISDLETKTDRILYHSELPKEIEKKK